MTIRQAIPTPFGITVFGSSTIRIEPDVASLNFSVSKTNKHPKDAFQAARTTAKSVQSYLAKAQINDAGSSRIKLEEAYDHSKFIGYRARIVFHVLLYDLNRIEEILIGIVDTGVNKITSVDFQTTRLKTVRVEARKQAIAAAQEKANVYCKAASVKLGNIIHIEDVNPDQLGVVRSHVHVTPQLEDDGPLQAFDPTSIVVSGAVLVAYEIANSSINARE